MEFTLKLDEKEVNLIHQILQDGPHRLVHPLLIKITEQVKEQGEKNAEV